MTDLTLLPARRDDVPRLSRAGLVEPVSRPPAHPRPWHHPGGLEGLRTRGPGQAVQARTHAFFNWGFWCVWCPFCPRPAQRVAQFQERFVCDLCSNAAAGGRWVEIAWPPRDAVREAMEILELRPMAIELLGEEHCPRNWDPTTEDIEFLRRENEQMGWPVPARAIAAPARSSVADLWLPPSAREG